MTQQTTANRKKTVRVKLEDLHLNEEDFLPKREPRYNEHHIRELAEILKRQHKLDPMTVWKSPEDGKFYVVSGHHRYRAYRKRKWRSPFIVQVYEGSLNKARLFASYSNAKTVLPLKPSERADTAWWLVTFCDEGSGYLYTIDETSKASGVSKRQVSYMRKVQKALLEQDELLDGTWQEAQLRLREYEPSHHADEDELVNTQAAKLDEEIGSAIASAGRQSPRALGMVLAQRLGGQTRAVFDWMRSAQAEMEYEEEDEGPECPFY
ncbi:MAG: hypothetical protein ACX93P_06925 [Roseovarius sp.]